MVAIVYEDREGQGPCKICGACDLNPYDHTAICNECGVLLYYPYPPSVEHGEGIRNSRGWYAQSASYNHHNFTSMIQFALGDTPAGEEIRVLDYGGGGGQFALVFKSLFPYSTVHIVDVNDDAILPAFRPLNEQIRFADFRDDETTFDYIFLCDVYEHLARPVEVLQTLSLRLRKRGKIFIDTPRQFWLYPFFKVVYPALYSKLLRGTVSTSHLQIWSDKAFQYSIDQANLRICKAEKQSEYTMPPDYYLRNMGVENPVIRAGARVFYKLSPYLARNKIVALLELAN